MSWTKRQILDAAFEEMGLAGYEFDITPEEQMSLLRKLDSMMAMWETYGIRVGYNRTVDPKDADPDQDSGLPDTANEAVYLNLAVRGAAGYGKALASSTLLTAKIAYDGLLSLCMSNPPQVQLRGNLPIGAGYKRPNANGGPFVAPPRDLLTTGPDGLLEFDGPTPV